MSIITKGFKKIKSKKKQVFDPEKWEWKCTKNKKAVYKNRAYICTVDFSGGNVKKLDTSWFIKNKIARLEAEILDLRALLAQYAD